MFVRRFYDDRLAQASYLIGCQRTGEAIVIDPPRDVAAIIAGAKQEGLRITRVTETHIHADFASGARELAGLTGARALLSAEGGEEWQYNWPEQSPFELLHHGDSIIMGGVELTVRHTPGHTPEHLSFLVTDNARSPVPVAMVTGDFLFVGDVGRPDLLERAAKVANSMEGSARALFHSIQALKDLPDHLQIWPGHGAGSACGKALGAMPSSTLGYERLTNWAFGVQSEDQFVDAVLEGQPTPPRYFAVMKQLNRNGAPILGAQQEPIRLDPGTLLQVMQRSVLVDVRPGPAFAVGHVKGSISLPLNKSFPTWAGWFIPYDRPITLLAADEANAAAARQALASIGLDSVAGYFDPKVLSAAEIAGRYAIATHGDIKTAPQLQEQGRVVIDLRAQSEWDAGHISGATLHPLGTIETELAELPRDTPVAIHCQGGGRSGIGASVLERMGFTDVIDLHNGYSGWNNP